MERKSRSHWHEIAPGLRIFSSSGIAPESDSMKTGADHSWKVTQVLFDRGILKAGKTVEGTPPEGTTLQENMDFLNALFAYGESLLENESVESQSPSDKPHGNNQ